MSNWQIVANAVVPALPDWYMLTLNREGELEEHEIIGWAVQVGEEGKRYENGLKVYWPKQSSFSTPVTIGLPRGDDWVIRRPNGTMFTPYEEFGTNKEWAIEYLKEMDAKEMEEIARQCMKAAE